MFALLVNMIIKIFALKYIVNVFIVCASGFSVKVILILWMSCTDIVDSE